MKQLNPHTEFDWVFLSKEKLELCKGCYRCLELGEDHCSIKDSRALIEQKMHGADGIIFTSPVYVANVSPLFKNFVDRFAYVCHRPRFHNKKAMVVCTTGSVAAGIVNILMTIMLETWGFTVVHKVGARLARKSEPPVANPAVRLSITIRSPARLALPVMSVRRRLSSGSI